MAEFTYVGDPGRIYLPPGAAPLTPEPGKKYELDTDPGDGRWEPVKRDKPAHKDPAPAGDTEE